MSLARPTCPAEFIAGIRHTIERRRRKLRRDDALLAALCAAHNVQPTPYPRWSPRDPLLDAELAKVAEDLRRRKKLDNDWQGAAGRVGRNNVLLDGYTQTAPVQPEQTPRKPPTFLTDDQWEAVRAEFVRRVEAGEKATDVQVDLAERYDLGLRTIQHKRSLWMQTKKRRTL